MRYIKQSLILIALVILLAACNGGTDISSKLVINEDGSGSRFVYAKLTNEHVSSLKGGLSALDQVLDQAKPASMEISRSGNVYTFKYDFVDINDYNRKTTEIIKKQHTASFVAEIGVFGELYAFSEPNVFKDVINWAIDAVDAAKIVNESKSDLFEMRNIEVNIPKASETYSSSRSTIDLQYDRTYQIDTIRLMTDYGDLSGPVTRRLEILFDANASQNLNEAKLFAHFQKFFPNVYFEEINGSYVFSASVESSESSEISKLTSLASGESYNDYIFEEDPFSNVLHRYYRLSEILDISPIYQGTNLHQPIIYQFKIPSAYTLRERSNYSRVSMVDNTDGVATYETYVDESSILEIELAFEEVFAIDEIKVEVTMDSPKRVVKKVQYILNAEMANYIGTETLDDHFLSVNPNMTVITSGTNRVYEEEIILTGSQETVAAADQNLTVNRMPSVTSFEKSQTSSLSKNVYTFYDAQDFGHILGFVNVNNAINYSFIYPEKYQAVFASNNSRTNNLEALNGKGRIEFSTVDYDDLGVKIILEKNNPTMMIIVIGLVLVVLGSGYLIYKRKFSTKVIRKEEVVLETQE